MSAGHLRLSKNLFTETLLVNYVGASIARPAGKSCVFADTAGEFVRFYRRAANGRPYVFFRYHSKSNFFDKLKKVPAMQALFCYISFPGSECGTLKKGGNHRTSQNMANNSKECVSCLDICAQIVYNAYIQQRKNLRFLTNC
jgi:hypothetical protein